MDAAVICLVLATSLIVAAHIVDAHLLPARADITYDMTLPNPVIIVGMGILVPATIAVGVSRTTLKRVLALCVAWPSLLGAGAWFVVAALGDWGGCGTRTCAPGEQMVLLWKTNDPCSFSPPSDAIQLPLHIGAVVALSVALIASVRGFIADTRRRRSERRGAAPTGASA